MSKNTKSVFYTIQNINIFVDNLGDPIIRIPLIALAVKVIFLIKEIENWINNYLRAMFDYKCSNMLLLNQ